MFNDDDMLFCVGAAWLAGILNEWLDPNFTGTILVPNVEVSATLPERLLPTKLVLWLAVECSSVHSSSHLWLMATLLVAPICKVMPIALLALERCQQCAHMCLAGLWSSSEAAGY